MASPQLENGHIRIANELFEALCRASLSGREFQVVNSIIRLTYGWGKKSDSMSLKQLADTTGIKHRPWLMRILQGLERQRVIIGKHKSGFATEYALNKNYEAWTCLPDGSCPVGTTCPAGGDGDMSRLQVGGHVPSTGRGPLPMDENIHNHDQNHVLKPKENNGFLPVPYTLAALGSAGLYKVPLVKAYLSEFCVTAIPNNHRKKLEPELVTLSEHPLYMTALGTTEQCVKCIDRWREQAAPDSEVKPLLYIMRWIAGVITKSAGGQ